MKLYAELLPRADNMHASGWHPEPDPGKYLPELPNFMQYYTRCHAHVVCTCHLHMSSAHIIRMCMSSAHVIFMRTSSRCTHVIRTSSAALLMVSVDLNDLSTLTGTGYWMELSQECWVVSFQDHINDLWDNLYWWFSLHVTSGHCSHVICICRCHPHIIWAYVYYVHIICSGPWYIPS